MSGSTINGSIKVDAGGVFATGGNWVGGSIQVKSNDGGSSIGNNQVKADIQIFSHRNGVNLTNTAVNGNMLFKKNSPAPTGGGNVVQGKKENQCRRL